MYFLEKVLKRGELSMFPIQSFRLTAESLLTQPDKSFGSIPLNDLCA